MESISRKDELDMMKQLPKEAQIEYLFNKVRALEDLILSYTTILRIAQVKADEFATEATAAIAGNHCD